MGCVSNPDVLVRFRAHPSACCHRLINLISVQTVVALRNFARTNWYNEVYTSVCLTIRTLIRSSNVPSEQKRIREKQNANTKEGNILKSVQL
jgi:hypothetical protein